MLNRSWPLLRYPLDLVWPNVRLAPYAIGGVGGLIDGYNGVRSNGTLRTTNKVLGDAGGGLEYRFTPHIGLFGEATYNIVDGPKNTSSRLIGACDTPSKLMTNN